jgi:hypothetical protein
VLTSLSRAVVLASTPLLCGVAHAKQVTLSCELSRCAPDQECVPTVSFSFDDAGASYMDATGDEVAVSDRAVTTLMAPINVAGRTWVDGGKQTLDRYTGALTASKYVLQTARLQIGEDGRRKGMTAAQFEAAVDGGSGSLIAQYKCRAAARMF